MSGRNDTNGTKSTTGVDVEALAHALDRARRDCTSIEPPSASRVGLGVGQAYAIQQAGLRLRLENGERLVGHKTGLTSAAMQRQLGVDEPDYGYLLAGMLLDGHDERPSSSGAPSACRASSPRSRFVSLPPLRGPGVTAADVLAATDALAPALEVVDSRITDCASPCPDPVADNASSGAVVAWLTNTPDHPRRRGPDPRRRPRRPPRGP